MRAKRGYTPLEVTLHNPDPVPHPLRLSFRGYGSGSAATERRWSWVRASGSPRYLLIPAPVQSGVFSVAGPNLRPRSTGVYLDEGNSISALVLGTSKAFEAGTGIPRAEDSKPPQVNTRFLPVQDAPRELPAYVGLPRGAGDRGGGLRARRCLGRAGELCRGGRLARPEPAAA